MHAAIVIKRVAKISQTAVKTVYKIIFSVCAILI